METFKITMASNPYRHVKVKNDCDGSPDCAVEMHIESWGELLSGPSQGGPNWQEAHMTVEESRQLRAALLRAEEEWTAQWNG